MLAGLGGLDAGGVVEIWPELALAVEAFLAVSTQWRVVAGMAGLIVTGFDYVGVRFGLRAAGIRITPELWADLQVMEIAARDALMGER